MSKKKQGSAAAGGRDEVYPFDTGDWARWTNVKRLNWLRNFRDRLLDEGSTTHYTKYGFTKEQVDQLIADTAAMEAVVAKEQAAMRLLQAGLKAEMDSTADELLKRLDKTGRKALFLDPKDILGKKGN